MRDVRVNTREKFYSVISVLYSYMNYIRCYAFSWLLDKLHAIGFLIVGLVMVFEARMLRGIGWSEPR